MTTANFFQRASSVRDRRPLGFIGQFVRSQDFVSITGINSNPQAKQITTVGVPGTVSNSTDYTVTINGVAVTVTTDGTATQAELGAAIAAAINATPGARAVAVASFLTATLTLTGVWPGVAYTVAISGGGANPFTGPTTTTAAAEADPVEFGRVVIQTGLATDESLPTCKMPVAADFTAQVMSFLITSGAGGTFTPSVTINGVKYDGDAIVHNTDDATTAQDIVDEINAKVPANTVIATLSTATVVLTAEVAGAEFDAEIIAAGAGVSSPKAYTTGPSLATSLRKRILGISVRREDVEAQTNYGDDPAYAGNNGVEICTRGRGLVERDTAETWAWGEELFVSVAAATAGRLYNAAGANRVWLGASPFRVDRIEHSTTTDGLAGIRLDMGV